MHIKKIILLITFAIFIFSCQSGKKDFNLEEETDDSILARGNNALNDGEYDEALKYYDMLLLNFPTSDLHIDAQLNIAKTLGGQEKYEEQLELLLRVLKENTIPDRIPQIFLQIGDFYFEAATWNPGDVSTDTTDWNKAAKYYRKAAFYPDSDDNDSKAKALYLAGIMYAKQRQIDTAQRAYEGVIAGFPGSAYSELARMKLSDPTNTEVLTPDYLDQSQTAQTDEEIPEELLIQDLPQEEEAEEQIKDIIMDSDADSLRQETQPQEFFETQEDTTQTDSQELFEQQDPDTTSEFE